MSEQPILTAQDFVDFLMQIASEVLPKDKVANFSNVLAEIKRLKAIEAAALSLTAVWEDVGNGESLVDSKKLDALLATVKGE